jgi:hypothetical protein
MRRPFAFGRRSVWPDVTVWYSHTVNAKLTGMWIRPRRQARNIARTTLGNLPTGGKRYHGLYNGVCVGYCGFYRRSLLIAEGPLFIADV